MSIGIIILPLLVIQTQSNINGEILSKLKKKFKMVQYDDFFSSNFKKLIEIKKTNGSNG